MTRGRGWHLEPTRHSLAARGVKTKSTRMKRVKYPKTNIDEIMDDELFFIRNDYWICQLDDGKDIRLGLALNIIDMREADRAYDDDEYPYVVEAQIFVVPEQMSKIYRDKLDLTQEDNPSEVIYAAQSYGGGIPATNQLEGITSGREGIVDSKVRTDKSFGYTRTSRWFKTFDDAEKYIREVYANNANALFGLIGFTLDAPVNRVGTTGWDLIKFQRKGTEWLKI